MRDCLLHQVRDLNEDDLTMALKRVFEKYNTWERGVNKSQMNKIRFQKVFRDSCLLCATLGTRDIDDIYCRICQSSHNTINFVQFIEGLRFAAIHNRLSLNEIIERIVIKGIPSDDACN